MRTVLPVFHIGANKAGSTTLQKALFARHPGVLNLGKPERPPLMRAAVEQMWWALDKRKNPAPSFDPAAARRAWQVEAHLEQGDRRVPVFSHEELIRYYLYGGVDPLRLPRAIVAMVGGPVRVMIVTRNQVKLIESLYIHKAKSAKYLSPDEWFASEPEWYASGYQFHAVADAWAQVVGKENVGVFIFEELASDARTFARRICDFIGIDAEIGATLLQGQRENVRKSNRSRVYAGLRSALLPNVPIGLLLPPAVRDRWHSYLQRGPLAKIDMPKNWATEIADRHRDDNAMLAKSFNLPLKDYGYPM